MECEWIYNGDWRRKNGIVFEYKHKKTQQSVAPRFATSHAEHPDYYDNQVYGYHHFHFIFRPFLIGYEPSKSALIYQYFELRILTRSNALSCHRGEKTGFLIGVGLE